eukprot:1326488-Prymnesium_polylepis.1
MDVANKVKVAYLDFDTPCPDRRAKCDGPKSTRAAGAYQGFIRELQKASLRGGADGAQPMS